MSFKFSLGAAKTGKASLNAKAKEEAEAKAREEKNALDKVMAEFEEEHGAKKSVLGEPERQQEVEEIFVPTGSKRHFTGRARTMKSGPGTLEAEPFDGYSRPGAALGRLAPPKSSQFRGAVPTGPAAHEAPKPAENVFTTVVAKASNLPPSIDPRRVEELFASFPALKVTRVEKVPPQGPAASGRPSATMKVVFDKDATARDLDDAMNKLNDKKYLGKGYYLHLDRYLGGRSVDTAQRAEPFGARWQAPDIPKGFAPPPGLGGGSNARDRSRDDREQLIITANQPPDAATLKLVHQTIEGVILGGVEFEAALMNDPQVQEEERFAWLYDQKHPVNRYYRWRLHQIVCDSPDAEIFKNHGIWRGPADPLRHEFVADLKTLDSEDADMDSDDEDEKEKPLFKPLPVGDNYPGRIDNGHGIMDPRSRVMLLWLITQIPPGSIVVDDIAAVTNFAMEHTNQGMDEVIHILVSNIIQPFQLTETNPFTRSKAGDADGKDDIRRPDLRQVTVNALRLVSDVLLVAPSGPSGSYKYRQAIGTEIVDRKVFEHLEQLPAQLEMGRMTERSYRDEINSILRVWQDERIFDEAPLHHIDEAFNARERQKEEEEQAKRLAEKRKRKGKVVRRAVSAGADSHSEDKMDVDDAQTPEAATPDAPAMEDVAPEQSVPKEAPKPAPQPLIPGETAVERARRLRPKAEDMFALDDE
ncbi:coatamer subunit [Pyrenophora seminiperda CCB06]|uniref:Coatamer subunit n=1 Tax=Pyrenophora seminiperda CCB06 TaxID=1302712 RepID=A0A3M7MAS5_9PLEO|nr:coatamer subunit [Pyrenophora seminiperda CCB06]